MKKKVLAFLSVVLIGAFLVACQGKESKENMPKGDGKKAAITIGTSGGYKPYTFLDENDKLTGFDIDVWKEIGKRTEREVEFMRADFSGLFGMLDNGQLTTIANQITVTDEREEKYLFTDGYVYYGAQLVSKKGNEEIKSLEDLKGKKVAVSLGSNYEEMVRDFDKEGKIEVVTYDGGGLYHDVSLGRIDAVLMDKLSALTAIEESGLDLQLAGDPVQELVNAFPFVKNEKNEELLKDVNKALVDMREDGTLKEISLKWFPIDITEK